MDYVDPKELMHEAVIVAEKKVSLSIGDMLIRGVLSGVFLGFATSLAVVVTAQGFRQSWARFCFPSDSSCLPYWDLRSTVGKIIAMWLPIMTFFAQGFEHSIVNMFVVPAGMMFGAPVSIRNRVLWNQLPVTLGNILSGTLFTGIALYATFREKSPEASEVPAMETDNALEAA